MLDHASEAATLILADLCDRRDISGAIEGCDADTRAEIHESLTAIIRELMDRDNAALRDRVGKLEAVHEAAKKYRFQGRAPAWLPSSAGKYLEAQARYIAACRDAGVEP